MSNHDAFCIGACIVGLWVLVVSLAFDVSRLQRRIDKLERKEPE